ncbi:EamA family transporter [Huintestinicola sp.]|nr:triose-phosphate transporter family protein [Oscillospiraceae bacterium]MDD7280176.1 EamA family transporter [Oscillospiraceae bacterium]
MSRLLIYSLILFCGVVISAFSQILLKKSAKKHYDSVIKEYLNPLVIIAYGMFFGCTLISVVAMRVVPLSMSPIIEATSYIITPLLSYLILGEKTTRKQAVGMAVIVAGIVVFVI